MYANAICAFWSYAEAVVVQAVAGSGPVAHPL